MVRVISKWDRNQRRLRLQSNTRFSPSAVRLWVRGAVIYLFSYSRRRLLRLLIVALVVIAILPPVYFHFKLRRFQQMQLQKCHWMRNPPLVCAHGGDSTNAFPNTMNAYNIALSSQVDCIEVDVSRSSDGALFALHDRDLQRLSGNKTLKVGHLSQKEISKLHLAHSNSMEFRDVNIATIQDALKLMSGSLHQVILDAKVGPPAYEKGLAKDIISVIERTKCKNCLVWAKSDSLVREIMKLSANLKVGYIVMMDLLTGTRSNLLRIRGATVVGIYYQLINEKLVKLLHRRNKKIYAWTVDDEDSMNKMLSDNVDAIVTSNPSLLQRVIEDARTHCLEQGLSVSSRVED